MGVWLCQVGDLRKLPVLTGGLERPGRHRVMLWSAQCFQCGCIAWCGELPPEDWCVEVALDRPDRAGALELLSTKPAQPYLARCPLYKELV